MIGKVDKKRCFVVGPIGDDDSDDRIHADWLLEEIILPVFNEHFPEYSVQRADKISNPGQINTQVITALLEAEIVIADLTTLNPNAFYEIGIRHTIQKPIIHMHIEGQRIPFDIAPFRSIKFSRRRPVDIRAARAALLEYAKEATDEAHVIDNPVTFSRGKLQFEKNATPSEKIAQEQMEYLGNRLDLIEMQLGNSPLLGGYRDHRRKARSIALEIRARQDTSLEQLKSFIDTVLLNRFPDAIMMENNGNNFVFFVPDTDQSRQRIETLKNDSALAAFAVDISVSY
ncbi:MULTISPECIES: hypothetical protein [Rhizobium]|uniref:Nucleoside 2-deoxyribosyltransferase n=1 Tax=Rhizobium tropici TaxID=398 RepID=A0A6P1C7G1_RHITR|nr:MULTISPECIES: hypothetical protein [Rhizobium]AGB70697.1 hypothetical protein RTCIAT899_CH06450 [Rhizobium tropici CIAT 899]MBB4241648.1 hypothetical protein [Rhizobium tropici]MBB5592612.1 hypothetical protein [Rhizobium tropici]MBB6491654.1 hypothetical protein [Rhizobium tropici]NEV10874.1 hypothetical protein [Rhizobium tropici]